MESPSPVLEVREFHATSPVPQPPAEPLRWREGLVIAALVVLSDVALFRGPGYSSLAMLLASAPLLLCLVRPERRLRKVWWLFLAMQWLLVARLVWAGQPLTVAIAALGLGMIAMTLAGWPARVPALAVFALQLLPAGGVSLFLRATMRRDRDRGVGNDRKGMLAITAPILAVAVFSVIFIMANPDLAASVGDWVSRVAENWRRWLQQFVPDSAEVATWGACAIVVAGCLRPLIKKLPAWPLDERATEGLPSSATSKHYAVNRNTLAAVVVLFALYLAFEFNTLWFREFPRGFHYSGYAHRGAAWLTVALALSTLTLSAIFQGDILVDARRRTLRRWAMVWSIENLLLAAAVIHRLLIYVDFNGMTRMRVVGFLGVAAVIAGFLLVLWKIERNRSLLWLLHADLWAVTGCIYLYAALPVDLLITRYNVDRIRAGDLAPAVQISVHPLGPDGYLLLPELLQSNEPVIREGVAAMLAAERARLIRSRTADSVTWKTWQGAEAALLERLASHDQQLKRYKNAGIRSEARKQFDAYAYQWY